MEKVSVIICTRNCEDSIEEVIQSAVENDPYELLVVDGRSTDNTLSIVEKYTDNICQDPGKGLAVARNIGFSNVTGDYIFFLGSDNVIEKETLQKTVSYMKVKGLAGCALPTRIKDPSTYYIKGLDFRWKTRFFESTREVIGTPSCFRRDILEKYGFDDDMSWSDDTDLGERLKKDNHTLGYSSLSCYEVGFDDKKTILGRFQMYGLSDFQFYNKYKKEWTLKRRLKSLFHPVQAEILDPLKRAGFLEALYYLPFLIEITFHRIKGFKKARKRHLKGV